MAKLLGVPRFLGEPKSVWVACESSKTLATQEIACSVVGMSDTRVIIALADHFDAQSSRLRGFIVGTVGEEGRLVDFPSGDRLLVSTQQIEAANGGPVGP